MRHNHNPQQEQNKKHEEIWFKSSAISDCTLLPGEPRERRLKVLKSSELSRETIHEIHGEFLMPLGFMRVISDYAYRLDCPKCTACYPARVLTDEFQKTSSLRSCYNHNARDVEKKTPTSLALDAHSQLFINYANDRFPGTDWTLNTVEIDFQNYDSALKDQTSGLRIDEYYIKSENQNEHIKLIASCAWYAHPNGAYIDRYYYDPAEKKRSLGSYMFMNVINDAREMGLAHVYVGGMTKEPSAHSYKRRFVSEVMTPDGEWINLDMAGF